MHVIMSLSHQLIGTFMLVGKQSLIDHAHDCDDTTHNGAHASKESDPSLPITFYNLHMQRAHFVKEKDAW